MDCRLLCAQALPVAVLNLPQLDLKEQHSVNFELKYEAFLSIK